jgi:hypothetical protein
MLNKNIDKHEEKRYCKLLHSHSKLKDMENKTPLTSRLPAIGTSGRVYGNGSHIKLGERRSIDYVQTSRA